jgi:type II restriction/modification system DNA methylase subunit YeeA
MSTQVNFPQLDIDRVTTCIKNAVLRAGNEEEVRMGVSRCIEDEILKPLGISQIGRYEYTLVSGARVDALYGHVIIEYKAPGKLTTARDIQRAKEQVIGYITKEAGSKQEYSRYLGVIISDRIAFVRYDARTDTWLLRGPYDIRRESIVKLIEALRGLRRKPLAVEHIVRDFGPKSPVTMRMVRILYKKLLETKNPRTKILFEDWLRLFRQATGYSPEELEELPQLAKEYGLGGNVQYDALIFSIHTYYALLLKLIAAEIAYLYGTGKFLKSYIAQLDDSYARGGIEELKETLKELEGGGIFRKLLSIENFLEGDYFSWYVDELDNELGDAISQLIRLLSDYEVATPQLEPEFARDLLKRLYQNLVPSELRHRLGEFYTPDWLANLLLDEVGLSIENLERLGSEDPLKPLELRVLDPACGSGTFLILYLSRLRIYAENHHMLDQLLHYVLDNVVGYDMNPLAVLTARTNYLLHIADLLTYASGTIEIPIYLADSIMLERKTDTSFSSSPTYSPTTTYVFRTVVGDFKIPASLVQKGYLPSILYEVSKAMESKYTVNNFINRIKAFYTLDEKELELLVSFYEKLLQLEEEKKNNVWVAIIRNAFAPILRGKFDFVVGNPPWINWENLPESYREASKDLWKTYGLIKVKKKAGLGKVKKDLSMLFLARSFDLYLKEGGKLAFLVPFTLFKTQAGTGFREFLITKTKIHVVHDLVRLYPFEGAVNRTAAIVVEKTFELNLDLDKVLPGEKEKYLKIKEKTIEENLKGIKHIIWINLTKKAISTDLSKDEVIKATKRYQAVMLPVNPNDPGFLWMQITPGSIESIKKILAGNQYEAHAGVYVGLNQVYHVQVKDKTPEGRLIITNPPEPGTKKKVKQTEAIIESDLIYPLIRGRDIKKWYVDFKHRYIIIPHNPVSSRPIPETEMKIKYPLTYQYLVTYKSELINRSIHKLWGKGNPFYAVYDIGPYTFAPYKVVWQYIAGEISGKAEFSCAVLGYLEDKFLGKRVTIPNEKLMLVPLHSEEEAYYLCGILNSIFIRAIVASYVIETEISTHILHTVKPPKFDPNDHLHKKIAELSKKAHDLAKCIYSEEKPDYCSAIDAEDELREVERELDLAVAQLLGLSEDDLREFERLYAILSGEELPVEEDVEVPQHPNVSVLGAVIKPGLQSFVEVDVVNPSGEEIEFHYEFPWGSGSFRLVEGKYRIDVPPLSPGKYRGVLRWVWRGEEQSKEVVVEVEEHEGPKRPRTLTGL